MIQTTSDINFTIVVLGIGLIAALTLPWISLPWLSGGMPDRFLSQTTEVQRDYLLSKHQELLQLSKHQELLHLNAGLASHKLNLLDRELLSVYANLERINSIPYVTEIFAKMHYDIFLALTEQRPLAIGSLRHLLNELGSIIHPIDLIRLNDSISGLAPYINEINHFFH